MANNLVRDESYIVILGWMVTDLNLQGIELTIYATIYGFSQDGASYFEGSRKYLMEWSGAKSLRTVDAAVQSLIGKGYIQKVEEYRNGVKFCKYKAIKILHENATS